MADFTPDVITIPDLVIDESIEAEFRRVWSVGPDAEGFLTYDASPPRHLFLRWLAEQEGYLLHGTHDGDIQVFEPRYQTDAGQRSVQAVFAAADGTWPIFFATVNRSRSRGSIRNWVMAEEGKRSAFFSISKHWMAEGEPFQDGVIYILPPDGFTPCVIDGVSTLEHLNPNPVRPLGKLRVTPADFPYLDRVTTHDDSSTFEFLELLEWAVLQADAASDVEDAWLLEYEPDQEIVEKLATLVRAVWGSTAIADLEAALQVSAARGAVALRLAGSSLVHQMVGRLRSRDGQPR